VPPLSPTVVDLDDNHTVGTAHWPEGETADGAQGQTIQGLECLPTMPETYHGAASGVANHVSSL